MITLRGWFYAKEIAVTSEDEDEFNRTLPSPRALVQIAWLIRKLFGGP